MNNQCDENLIKMDLQMETIESTVCDLKKQIKILEHQNSEIRLKLNEEV